MLLAYSKDHGDSPQATAIFMGDTRSRKKVQCKGMLISRSRPPPSNPENPAAPVGIPADAVRQFIFGGYGQRNLIGSSPVMLVHSENAAHQVAFISEERCSYPTDIKMHEDCH